MGLYVRMYGLSLATLMRTFIIGGLDMTKDHCLFTTHIFLAEVAGIINTILVGYTNDLHLHFLLQNRTEAGDRTIRILKNFEHPLW
jgi:hypothetical protein